MTKRTGYLWADVCALFSGFDRQAVDSLRRTVGLSRRTVLRYQRGSAVPAAVFFAAALAAGRLDVLHGRAWTGLRVSSGGIDGTPYGEISASEIRALPYWRAVYRKNHLLGS